MKILFNLVLFILLTILFVWSITTTSGIQAAIYNNAWSVKFLKYYFYNAARTGILISPPPSFIHSSLFFARDAMKSGDATKALMSIKEAKGSSHPLTKDNFASLLYLNGDYEQAVEAWITVGDDVTLERAANDLGTKGLSDLSIKAFEGLYTQNPEKYTSSLAVTLSNQQKYEEALKLYQESLSTYAQSKNRTSWLRYTADIYARQGKFKDAESSYLLASVENPKDAKTWRNLGLLYIGHLNDPIKASECFQKIIEINPEDTYGYLLLAKSYVTHGQVDSARQAYRKVLEIDPQNTTALEALERLENSQ